MAALMPPASWAGSEIALHNVLSTLVERGHEVRSFVQTRGGRHGSITSTKPTRVQLLEAAKWADVLLGQQSAQHVIVKLGEQKGRPAVIWAHTWAHDSGPPSVAGNVGPGVSVWANSEAGAAAIEEAHNVHADVMRPLVRVADYRTTPGDAVGLVNLSALKGGRVLFRLATSCPQRQFVGRHGWGPPFRTRWPSNVEVQNRAADMATFYSRIRVLLMPAKQESWGRVGVEAGASGIPVIGHPTPGLTEALGDAAMLADREDPASWMEALEQLDDPRLYRAMSEAAQARAAELEQLALADLDRFETSLCELAVTGRRTNIPASSPKTKSKANLLRVAVLVPWKPGVPARERAWRHVQAHWAQDFPGWPLIEGHHAEEPFNRSRAINTAAAIAGPHDVFVIADADSLVDGRQVLAAVEKAHRTGRITFAHDEFRALSHRGTQLIIEGRPSGNWDRFVDWRMKDTASSCVAVPWALWERIGGFDERFEGWGYEDVAMSVACQVLGGGFERVTGPVWHLHHPKSPTNRPGSPTYLANTELCGRYVEAYESRDEEAMAALVDEAKATVPA